ncbi:MAG TPA: hypothetical protein VF790_11070 [Dissulfurispiraceae bacterium]
MRYLAVCLLFSVVCFPRHGMSETEEGRKGKGVEVAILCFSGRPVLRFALNREQEIRQLMTLVGKSEKIDDFKGESVLPAVLGYRGIEIENPDKLFGFPWYLAVYKGAVETIDGQHLFYRDKEYMIEKFIVDLAYRKKMISKDVRDMLLEDITE